MRWSVLALAGLLAFGSAEAAEIKPAVVYDAGGKFDKSFNEGVYNGAERFKRETGTEYRDFEITSDAQREQALRRFARDGHSPIVAVGFSHQAALEKVAKDFPNTRFTIIDAVVEAPNVQSILFKEHEGSYLVGLLGAMAAPSAKVGFVGGMDVPLIRKFACGYVQGAKAAKPGVEVFQNMTGTTPSAWNDPVRGAELARSQFSRGADVVYHAAGGTGLGVLQAAADAGKLAIGVDSNQNGLQPGRVLTSMLKRVDVAAYKAFQDARADTWKPGLVVLGLAEDGIAWALDEHNAKLITPEMKAAADKAAADIKSGALKVHDAQTAGPCPVS